VADVPLTVKGKMPGETVAGTDTLTVWLLPGATVKGETGDVLAPAGNPESATVTESEKPLLPAIDTEKFESEPPAVTVTADGDGTILKSFRGSIFRATLAVWVIAADVPLTVRA